MSPLKKQTVPFANRKEQPIPLIDSLCYLSLLCIGVRVSALDGLTLLSVWST